ncbi:50S ribosomal protein L7ae-like protein [Tepidibacillus fermentans]|uniref:RNA-binding protein EDD72_11249 n=1 Tax=Tepidibacillus fermentans TaxID=1281767 RepID=A0A4R3KEN4_9BACI|nr:50S ribosomal protein L7ae-like protein [Tepidibacillus fermentans]TCS81555.1 large subunit ribosomal protein L7A [Tepidibacillus fermentans]
MSYEKVKQAKHLSIGLKQTLKSLERDAALEIVVAKDAERRVTQKVIQLAEEKKVPIFYVDSMKQLGKACGIEVGASTVAILRS